MYEGERRLMRGMSLKCLWSPHPTGFWFRYNKPRYVGVTILAYAKYKLYDFHYNQVLPLFSDPAKQVRVLMCDTGKRRGGPE